MSLQFFLYVCVQILTIQISSNNKTADLFHLGIRDLLVGNRNTDNFTWHMAILKSVRLPEWLDDIIYNEMERINDVPEIRLSVNIVPQGLFVENEMDLQDFVKMPNSLYHFVISFKALNEFVQSNTFPNKNVYDLVSSYLLPLLDEKGENNSAATSSKDIISMHQIWH